ncbi:MAG: phenylphosphate carboxylase subunit delta [Alphaproteobacteria bacterium CG_4_10_14_0_2_um_filter_63_37]|nr:MAG: hypothetical protein AUJ55_09975 [Proteobacteria bacterium CG1_02_64_396]PJA24286.1 MAG: phenylphosphate carboxylase subunit delta [Alphaproteobacteria bacterium CG_4_10_14_0_2_um_filter_63_37]
MLRPNPHWTPSLLRRARNIQGLICDIDGVMTDGGIVYDSAGAETKRFHVRDGHAIKLAGRHGLKLAIITGRTSTVTARRAEELGFDYLEQRALRKIEAFERIVAESGIPASSWAMIGDDVVDAPVMNRCGLAVAPGDAGLEIARHADWQTPSESGRGVVADVIRLVLSARGKWSEILAGYGIAPGARR